MRWGAPMTPTPPDAADADAAAALAAWFCASFSFWMRVSGISCGCLHASEMAKHSLNSDHGSTAMATTAIAR